MPSLASRARPPLGFYRKTAPLVRVTLWRGSGLVSIGDAWRNARPRPDPCSLVVTNGSKILGELIGDPRARVLDSRRSCGPRCSGAGPQGATGLHRVEGLPIKLRKSCSSAAWSPWT